MFKDFLKTKLPLLWQEQLLHAVSLFILFILLVSFLFIIFSWPKLPPEIPFFYSLPWGKDRLGDPIYLVFLLLGTVFLALINFFLSLFLWEKYSLGAKILVIEAAGLVLLSAYGLARIILLIT